MEIFLVAHGQIKIFVFKHIAVIKNCLHPPSVQEN